MQLVTALGLPKNTERVGRQLHNLLDFSPVSRKENETYGKACFRFTTRIVYWPICAIYIRSIRHYCALGFGRAMHIVASSFGNEILRISLEEVD
ncbi:hypothetical protein [Planomicrobium sp. CPCC 101110]|uniref:hypothetical protein n=1 Tax=Planomicrobium sp. CPCC 101110 TaxID=2599619 RepID=UPI0011B8E1A1|nr:hypothetical protein [Planomicrobium sp. CPCC 101110]TWT26563.1 hypothetical protein FQV30_07830 [Planomicrobium sp. CPCC 101110]